MKKKIVILYSGGLDSLLMRRLAEKENPDAEVILLFFNYGQESLVAEMTALPEGTQVRDLPWLDENIKAVPKKSDPYAGAIYIPGRNLAMATMAACLYLPDQIWLGVLADENNEQATDKNEEFRELANKVLTYTLSPFADRVDIRFPFVEHGWTKTDALRYCLENGVVTEDEVLQTYSCWHVDRWTPCGNCKQCLKRALVLRNFGLYEQHATVSPLDEKSPLKDLMAEYEKNEATNADEAAMKKLIRAFRAGSKYWEV